jgi:hypothetical protein
VEISCLAYKEPNSPGECWNSLENKSRTAYVVGIKEGVLMCMIQALKSTSTFTNKEDKSFLIASLNDYDNFVSLFYIDDDYNKFLDRLKTVVNIISDLYKDPANTYISIVSMCLIASRKLRGEPIELLLRELRKEALP